MKLQKMIISLFKKREKQQDLMLKLPGSYIIYILDNKIDYNAIIKDYVEYCARLQLEKRLKEDEKETNIID